MAFRADEAARIGYEQVEAYLVPRPRDASEAERARSKEALLDILDELGPVVDAYPTWHPLVCNHDSRHPTTTPSDQCGYKGLDHTRFFAKGFITCPYTASGKAQRLPQPYQRRDGWLPDATLKARHERPIYACLKGELLLGNVLLRPVSS